MNVRQFFSHRKLGIGVFLSLGLCGVVIGQMVPLGFWSGMATLGSFSISGVRGSTDTTSDAWLVNDTNPTIVFGASTGATSYDVVIKNAADSAVICQTLGATSTSVAVTACSLANNTSYRAHVTAKVGAATRVAANDSFSFTVDNTTPTVNTITGITGASDSTADGWLVSGLLPTVNWNAFTNASSYDVTIKDLAGSAIVCALQNTASITYNFSSCTLTDATTYKAYVTAKSPSGFNVINASNTGFNFTVDNTAPGAFSITGITGGTDAVIDAFLSNGSNPTVNYGNSSGVYRYDITIKDSTGTTTICSNLNQTGSPTAVASCALSNGVSYKAYVTSKSISTFITTNASNTGYSFTVGAATTPPGNFSITGATGGADTTADHWITSGVNVTANWGAALGATSYDVVIRNSGDTADVCATQNTTSTNYAFSTCSLTVATIYVIKVTAKNPSTTAALNNVYSFQIPAQDAGLTTIAGATGGADTTADAYLMAGTTVTASWGGSAGSYNVTIRNSADTADVCSTQNTTATSFTFTGCVLAAGTSYKLKVVGVAGARTYAAVNSPFSFELPASLNFCPTGSSTAKALIIYDSGGAAGNYANSESCNFTISPPATASEVVMNFTAFSTSATSDVLTTYDGTTTAGTLLGSFKNTSTPPANITAYSGNMYLTWSTGPSGVTTGYAMNYRTVYNGASFFNITGVKGGSDVTADTYLTDNSAGVTVDWDASPYAISYSVTILEPFISFNPMVVCGPLTTTSLSLNLPSCSLMAGANYLLRVDALDKNGGTRLAQNALFPFQYNNRPIDFSITGITGGTDTSADAYLESGTAPTVNWTASLGQTSYDVTVYENDGSTIKCATVNVAGGSTSHAFASCTLVNTATYIATVIANNANGSTAASNNGFSFYNGISWSPTTLTLAPAARRAHTAVWTGSEMIIWGGTDTVGAFDTGGKYNPTTDSWTATSAGSNVPAKRSAHTAVWTGTHMLIWGGAGGNSNFNGGGKYHPGTDAWISSPLLSVVDARTGHSTVWTGTEMIVWGGDNPVNTGARYNPATDSWTPTSTGTNVPSARMDHTAVWDSTGGQMIIWGGTVDSLTYFDTGGKYNPTSDTWTSTSIGANVPVGRSAHTAVWTGTAMIIWGGTRGGGNYLNTGGRYNPTSDTWTATSIGANVPGGSMDLSSVWTGTEMIVWGGFGGANLNTGGKYNPSTDTWAATSVGTNVPSGRSFHTAVWTGSQMIIWGGSVSGGTVNSGGKYNPSANTWAITSIGANLPSDRASHSAVWTGTEMIIWGGQSGAAFSQPVNTGGRYTPGTDSWTATSIGANVPSARVSHTGVWTGSLMLVWGGTTNTGGKYNPTGDSWAELPAGANVPSARSTHATVWTGTEMIVWGGSGTSVTLNSGGKYNPSTDTWTTTSVGAGVPSIRYSPTAVWTGTEMIVWAGINLGTRMNTGGRYNASTDTWTATSTGANVPTARGDHAAVWTGTQMIVWGGYDTSPANSGARYNPSTDVWTPTSLGIGAPVARHGHTALWNGSSMIVWGGNDSGIGVTYNTGAKYNPATDLWTATAIGGSAPVARQGHTAVWTGSSMLIWGGKDSTNNEIRSGGALTN